MSLAPACCDEPHRLQEHLDRLLSVEATTPPHLHARYAGQEAKIAIDTAEMFEGQLPRRAYRLVRGGPSYTVKSSN